MDIFLPVAGVDVNLLLIIAAGVATGFAQGMLSIGGFLLTPLLIMMGISPEVAATATVCSIAGASVSGTIAHYKAGHVDIRMALLLLVGGVTGGGIGTALTKILSAMGDLDVVILICYAVFMAIMGISMFVGGLTSHVQGEAAEQRETGVQRFLARLPFRTRFETAGVETSALAPLLLGLLVGILAALMGVGGGFLMVPVLSSVLGMPMAVVVGTSIFRSFFTSSAITLMQAAVNHNVDAILAALLLLGSTVGAQLGALTVKHLKASQLKVAFSLLVLAMSLKFLNDLLSAPTAFLVAMGVHR
ncbi:MAG: sulfite exporter TauE/SafE family protein [Acidobacteriota bacterium]